MSGAVGAFSASACNLQVGSFTKPTAKSTYDNTTCTYGPYRNNPAMPGRAAAGTDHRLTRTCIIRTLQARSLIGQLVAHHPLRVEHRVAPQQQLLPARALRTVEPGPRLRQGWWVLVGGGRIV